MIGTGMNRLAREWFLPLLAALAFASPSVAGAQQRERVPGDRGSAERSRNAPDMLDARPAPQQTRPLPDIVARVQATPPYNRMDYIGVANFDQRSMAYVLRFLDGRQVVVVRVDARSGRIVGTGH